MSEFNQLEERLTEPHGSRIDLGDGSYVLIVHSRITHEELWGEPRIQIGPTDV